eukprot:jgi/Mesen1/5009/ME000025S04409
MRQTRRWVRLITPYCIGFLLGILFFKPFSSHRSSSSSIIHILEERHLESKQASSSYIGSSLSLPVKQKSLQDTSRTSNAKEGGDKAQPEHEGTEGQESKPQTAKKVVAAGTAAGTAETTASNATPQNTYGEQEPRAGGSPESSGGHGSTQGEEIGASVVQANLTTRRGRLPCAEGCSLHGTCNEELGRCDCPGDRGGDNCAQKAMPACYVTDEHFTACHGRGACVEDFCKCEGGAYGIDCSLSMGPRGISQVYVAPGVRGPKRRRGLRPTVYVYELPAYMNAWLGMHGMPTDRPEAMVFTERLLHSQYRTCDGDQADFYFVINYIRATWPYWNATEGRRHLWVSNDDHGTCEYILRRAEPYKNSIVLTLWGYMRNMHGEESDPCFIRGQDVAIPPIETNNAVGVSPHLAAAEGLAAAIAPPKRETLLYFSGNFGVDDGRGYFSLGARQKLFTLFGNRKDTGFVLQAGAQGSFGSQMQRAKFCFAPAGAGYGVRATQSVVAGCIPVVVQENVTMPFDGLLMDWKDFAVVLNNDDLPRLPEILAGYSEEQQERMRQSGAQVFTRFLWRSPSLTGTAEWAARLPGQDAFDSIMEVLALRTSKLG